MTKQPKFSEVFYNPISYLGVVVSVLVFVVEVILFGLEMLSSASNLYLGLITYLILPGVLLTGLLLIPLGAIWRRRQIRRGEAITELAHLRLDLSIPTHRNAILVFIIGSGILMLMSMAGSYKAYQYTESVEFCGTLCHNVMHPEYTAYKNSPHGKVKCVECHIGSGADWFVKSKASGLRQVYHVILGDYHRPIEVPVHNLRPAADTCQECHWAGKFFGVKNLRKTYYLAEQNDRKWITQMDLHMGGHENKNSGVHAHMNLDQEVYYAAEDAERQKITWVKSVKRNGEQSVFVTKTSAFKETPPRADQIRKMDCIDCHNRPTHQFSPPDRLINGAMERNEIDAAMPEIKERGVSLLAKHYTSTEEALLNIRTTLATFYKEKHPDYLAQNATKVEQATLAIQKLFTQNMFPMMNARWDMFPDNIGHMNTPGCFRCHDNKHRNEAGSAITNKCDTCHTIVAQGFEGALEKNLDGLEYKHPDGEEDWKTTPCTKCHNGGA